MAQIITARNCCENRIWAENKQISEQARKSLWLRKVPRPLLSRAVCFANKWTTKMYPALYPKPKGCHAQSSVKSQSSDDPAFVLRNRQLLCGSKIIRRASLDPSIQNVHQNNHYHPKCPTLCLIFRETQLTLPLCALWSRDCRVQLRPIRPYSAIYCDKTRSTFTEENFNEFWNQWNIVYFVFIFSFYIVLMAT